MHSATLRGSGSHVAVKLQYPGLESAVASDLATFSGLTSLVGLVYPDLQFKWVVDDLRDQLSREVDFQQVRRHVTSSVQPVSSISHFACPARAEVCVDASLVGDTRRQ